MASVGVALAGTALLLATSGPSGDGAVLTDDRVAVAPTAPAATPGGARPALRAGARPRSRSRLTTPPTAGWPDTAASGPADVPVRFTVAGAGVDQPVVPVGLAADGALALPADPATAGWYRFGAWPGRPTGTAVIAAHVNSRALGAGPMTRLARTRVGDEVTVWNAGGRRTHYRVTSVGSAPKSALPVTDLFARGGTARLALVTCGGSFDTSTRSYRDNEIVWAVPV